MLINIRKLKLTDHFYGSEALTTTRNVDNYPPDATREKIISNITNTAIRLEYIREILGDNPITISSWYRSPELNALVGGSKNSDHMTGAAVDFICPAFGTPLEICKELTKEKHSIPFKQLIYEHTWVHIAFDFRIPYTPPKLQVLTLLSSGKYATGLTDKSGFKL